MLRFIRADRPRLLIADGVGVGKTIEAGLLKPRDVPLENIVAMIEATRTQWH